ncbi:MAG: sterol desaturase family protein [Burkholderiales bacterium]|nr:sterol desaturase family protein [Burkholderiales bacterium]
MWINAILEYWLSSPWPIAIVIATAVHLTIYLVGAGTGTLLTTKLWPRFNIGRTLDPTPPRAGQLREEFRAGLVTCLIFGIVTLLYRPLCHGVWPGSWGQGLFQLLAFSVFNNLYTYSTHRLLHSRALIRYHRVHHRSVRLTPWSGYSVHPVEALIIGATLPVFMLFVPIGIGAAFFLHDLGMLYTTCIHCNYELMPSWPARHWLKRLIDDPAFHRVHHTQGNVNYGFPSRVLDRVFRTNKE